MPYHQNSAGHGGRRCETRGRPKLRYMDTIKRVITKNGLTDVNILDRKDYRLAVSMKVRR